MLSSNTILRERYRIISQLGRGGMGAVYQAMDENLSCLVVVKETFATNDEQRQAFRREAQLLANLSHPTLPKVMDHFTHDRGQFLVMQFVSGHDLAELMSLREQPFAVEKVLGWADQLLDVLDELHSYDPPIVHRDIKPSNLKLTPKDKIILLDFGLAKGAAGQMSTADADSQPQSIYGYTLNYAPLEQIRGAGTDPRSDLYSLGATMWSLLTGQVPPDALARVGDKEEGKPDPLRPAHDLNPRVPINVSEALQRAMSLNRNQRPATAGEMRNLLSQGPPSAVAATLVDTQDSSGTTFDVQASDSQATMQMLATPLTDTATPTPAAPTLRVARPASVSSSEARPVAATVASGPPIEAAKKGSRNAIIGGSVAVLIAAFFIVVAGAIVLTIWRPRSKVSNLSTNRNSSTAGASSFEPPKNIVTPGGIELVWIAPGNFMMGSNSDLKFTDNERPVHQVTISKGFYMGIYEVTRGQWLKVMGTRSFAADGCGLNCPVDYVSWDDAREFISKLNQMQDGYSYRLPTEAEWEYACRAGATGEYRGNLDSVAWFGGNAGAKSHPVGQKQPNAFGLYDMIGNVNEWVEDSFHKDYVGAPTDGSAWVSEGEGDKAMRGGSFWPQSGLLRATARGFDRPSDRSPANGFRIVALWIK